MDWIKQPKPTAWHDRKLNLSDFIKPINYFRQLHDLIFEFIPLWICRLNNYIFSLTFVFLHFHLYDEPGVCTLLFQSCSVLVLFSLIPLLLWKQAESRLVSYPLVQTTVYPSIRSFHVQHKEEKCIFRALGSAEGFEVRSFL